MKRLTTFFITFVIITVSIFAPFSVSAKTQEMQSEAMYKVNEKVYADAYMLINLDDSSLPVIAAKNQNKKKYPASLTKIVTAMVTINNVPDLSKKAKVSQGVILSLANTGAQIAGLEVGEERTIEELLYLTMVYSACDACRVLGEYVAGSVDNFVSMMNDWVQSLGCENTHFTNADGLHDDDHYSTAADMATITLEALKNDTFVKISTTKSIDYKKYTFIHTNFMLDKFHVTYYYEYAEGIKTGSTTEAGYCVITKASKDGYNYLAVVMDSPIKKLDGIDTKCSFIDAATLFDWAFNSLKYSTTIRKNDLVTEVPVNNGKDADTVQLVAKEDVTTLVPSSLDASAVIVKPIDPPESLNAPITKGDEICKAEIIYANKVIAKTKLVAAKTVELSAFLKIFNGIRNFFGNKFVLAILLILIVVAIIYIIVFAKKLKKEKKRIAEKRRRQRELDEQLNNGNDYIEPPRRN
ncbi:MAG: D-alanyl-D-alanine carboxypeptidase [Eubacterium sp.]|nr:D-alanyl-D-alanine carboxypeptidase [Eubacterium sp.]